MARSKAAMGILASMALVAIAFPIGACAEPPQLSPVNNSLYLHYNMTYQQGWMNVNASDARDDGWAYHGGIFGRTNRIFLRFIMNPGLNGSLRLMLDPAGNWRIKVEYFEGYGRIAEVNGALTVGDYYCSTPPQGTGSFNFTFYPGYAELTSNTPIVFNFSFIGQGGDFVPNDLHIRTGGNSTLTMPIVAVDSDGDGHDDARDVFPSDPARWKNPKAASAKGFLPGFDALPAVIALGAMSVLVLRRRLPKEPLRCLH